MLRTLIKRRKMHITNIKIIEGITKDKKRYLKFKKKGLPWWSSG